ncbi:MAG: response regulator [Gorillibacterium sp.]|nr:response regulator [Gorillibacterium sp.]
MYQVMLVDDEPWITEGLSLMLDWSQYGFQIAATASNGLDALNLLQFTNCHLLITDIRMPLIEGLELIRRAKEMKPKLKVLVISGYNDFAYAKQAITYGVKDYMLKPIVQDELVKNLIDIKLELEDEYRTIYRLKEREHLTRDKLLYDISEGIYLTDNVKQLEQEYKMTWSGSLYCHLTCEIVDFHKLVAKSVMDAKLYHFGVRNILEEYIQKSGLGEVYEDLEGLLGIILTLTSSEEAEAFAIASKVSEAVKQYLRIDLYWGIGLPVSTLPELQHSKAQSRRALEHCTLGKDTSIRQYQAETALLNDLVWDSEKLYLAVLESDLRAMEDQVNELMDEITQKGIPRYIVEGLAMHIFYTGKRLASKQGGTNQMAMIDLERRFREWVTYQEFGLLLMEFCRVISKETHEEMFNHLIIQLELYISEHYKEEISLKSLAQKFYMNPAYLGQLFKKAKGENFNDYLNKFRISKVKQAVGQGDKKIYDIIMNAGYSNPEYFYRLYKKYEGISFSEFNKMRKQL